MRGILKNLSIYLMTAILFVASTGFTLFSHFCSMDEERTISAQKIDICCVQESTTPEDGLNSDCCIYNSTYLKFDFTGSTQKSIEFTEIPVALVSFNIDLSTSSTSTEGHIFRDLPPPTTGREILLSKQVFRI